MSGYLSTSRTYFAAAILQHGKTQLFVGSASLLEVCKALRVARDHARAHLTRFTDEGALGEVALISGPPVGIFAGLEGAAANGDSCRPTQAPASVPAAAWHGGTGGLEPASSTCTSHLKSSSFRAGVCQKGP